ncbi:MAG: LysM peptidoglycan-binding domain-containing protein [Bacilli bacterium]
MPGGEGAEIVYALRNDATLAEAMLNNIGEQGQKMRKVYQRRLPENPSQDYYYIIRQTNPLQSLLVEYGFIDNQADVKKLQNNLLNYVEGVVKAIADYANVPYTSPGTTPPTGNEYIVKKGDTLYSIAKLLNTTVEELKRVNNLSSNSLSIGQILLIPGSNNFPENITYDTYVVKAGDTLYQLAATYETSVEELKRLNNLTNNNLSIGQTLIVPKVSQITPPFEVDTYIVEAGDTLYSISRKFNISIDELKRLNSLNNDILSIGQTLILKEPVNDNVSSYMIYTVERGDSLYSIAQKYGSTVEEIRSLNNLKSDLLTIGQQLKIPNNIPTETYIIYTVEPGDSLYSIAKKYNITVDDIKQANNLTNNLLLIGQTLSIPTTNM